MSGRRHVWWFEDGVPMGGWRRVLDEPEFDLEPDRSLDWLDAALETLTPKQRFVLERSWGINGFEQYSFRQIAEFMGVDHSTVRGHYRAAMQRLSVTDPPTKHLKVEDEYA